MSGPELSKYATSLESHVKQRYLQKIEKIGVDPVNIPDEELDPECLPPIEQSDLFSFLVLETSYYTNDQFKNYKSLEAYNQVVSGFVASVKGKLVSEKRGSSQSSSLSMNERSSCGHMDHSWTRWKNFFSTLLRL